MLYIVLTSLIVVIFVGMAIFLKRCYSIILSDQEIYDTLSQALKRRMYRQPMDFIPCIKAEEKGLRLLKGGRYHN
jgi:hypothetical protein